MTRGGLALVISDLGPGGAQRVVVLLAREWARRGRAVTVVTFDDGGCDHFALPPGVCRVVVGGIGESRNPLQALVANIGRVLRLRRAVRRTKVKTVVSFIGVTNIAAILASIAAPWRLAISERNDPARQSLGRPWDDLRRYLYRHADLVTANSEAAIGTMRAFVPVEKLRLARNPLDLEHFRPRAEQARRPFILAVGRLTEQKAYDVLIDAFAEIAPMHPKWRLRIAGAGPLAEPLARQAASRRIGDRVDWLGVVEDSADLYREASVFVLSSRYEGVANALLEAMASGCAVIVSDASGGPLEYVHSEQTGVVVPVDDVAALAGALTRLIQDDALRCRLGQAAIQRVEANGVEAVVGHWSEVLGLEPAR